MSLPYGLLVNGAWQCGVGRYRRWIDISCDGSGSELGAVLLEYSSLDISIGCGLIYARRLSYLWFCFDGMYLDMYVGFMWVLRLMLLLIGMGLFLSVCVYICTYVGVRRSICRT